MRSSSFWGKLKMKNKHTKHLMIRNERGFAFIFKEYPFEAASPSCTLKALTKQLCVNWRVQLGLKAVIDACDGPRLGQWRMKLLSEAFPGAC